MSQTPLSQDSLTFSESVVASQLGTPLLHDDTGTIQGDRKAGVIATPKGQGTPFVRAVFLLMNAILGAGLLGQAYAARHSGYIVFPLVLLAVAGAAFYAIHLLLQCCEMAGVTSYEEVGLAAFGKKGRAAAAIAIMIQNFGAMSSYLVIMGDVLPALLAEAGGGHAAPGQDPICKHWWCHRVIVMVAVAALIVWPLTWLQQIGKLGYSSGVSILIMIFFTFMSLGKMDSIPCPIPGQSGDVECGLEPVSIGLDTFYVLPTLSFSFVCHTALLPIYSELRDRTPANMGRVGITSMGLAFGLYLAAGLAGYQAFGSAVDSDVLKSFTLAEPDNGVITAARIMVVAAVTVTVPLILYPFRKALILLFFAGKPVSLKLHVTLGTCVLVFVGSVAIAVPAIKDVFGAAGCTSSVALVFVLPGLFYLKLTGERRDRGEELLTIEAGGEWSAGGQSDGSGAGSEGGGELRTRKSSVGQKQAADAGGVARRGSGTGSWRRGFSGHRCGALFLICAGLVVGVASLSGIILSWVHGGS